jgi:hypothetical protein
MAIRNLIILLTLVFSVSILAQEMTQEEKVKAVKEFCGGLDINGKVINVDKANYIKKICEDKANAEKDICRAYTIDEDGVVSVSDDKIDDIRLVCKQLFAKTEPDRAVKQEASFLSELLTYLSNYQRPIGGWR